MNPYSRLFETINQFISLPNNEMELSKQYFEPLLVPKNTLLAEQNKVPAHIYFINSGYMRLFYHDQEGNEHTTLLSSPNAFIVSFLPFVHQIKATENLEALTDCELLSITNSNLRKLIEETEKFKLFSITIFEQAIRSTALRANDLATLNAKERYKKLLEQQPQLLQNVPIQYIASYLGMKPESLSRIRRQIIY